MIRSRGRSIRSRCWSIRCRGGVMRCRGVMRFVMVFNGVVVTDFSFVFDISVVLLVFINIIVNNLCTTIRQLNGVLAWKNKHV